MAFPTGRNHLHRGVCAHLAHEERRARGWRVCRPRCLQTRWFVAALGKTGEPQDSVARYPGNSYRRLDAPARKWWLRQKISWSVFGEKGSDLFIGPPFLDQFLVDLRQGKLGVSSHKLSLIAQATASHQDQQEHYHSKAEQ